jgi:virulence-associated protein VapD
MVLARANELQRVLFTRDDDFLAIANQLLQEETNFIGIIYAAQQMASIGVCVRDLELIAKVSDLEDFMTPAQLIIKLASIGTAP